MERVCSRSAGSRLARLAALLAAGAGLAACASAPAPPPLPAARFSTPAPPPTERFASRGEEVGVASWYGEAYQGRRTANGERFDMRTATAAHPSLPMPSLVEVTNLENGRRLTVRVNDRLPLRGGRVLDLSKSAAEQLGFARQGTARVRVRYLGPAGGRA